MGTGAKDGRSLQGSEILLSLCNRNSQRNLLVHGGLSMTCYAGISGLSNFESEEANL